MCFTLFSFSFGCKVLPGLYFLLLNVRRALLVAEKFELELSASAGQRPQGLSVAVELG